MTRALAHDVAARFQTAHALALALDALDAASGRVPTSTTLKEFVESVCQRADRPGNVDDVTLEINLSKG